MLKIADADSEEHRSGSGNLVIAAVSCSLPPPDSEGLPRRGEEVLIQKGSRAHSLYRADRAEEVFLCRYEPNTAYQAGLAAAGLRLSAQDRRGSARIAELPGHPFYLATLFLPQLASSPGKPHPLIRAFVEAAGAEEAGR